MQAPALPIIVTRATKLPAGAVLLLAQPILYMLTNHFPIFPPRLLPMTAIDQWVPLLPVTFWIYASVYFLIPVVYFLHDSSENLNKFFYSFFSVQLFSCTVFLLWPTAYPRELFPLPEGLDPLTAGIANLIRGLDEPLNCCPSLHVSSIVLMSLIHLDHDRKRFPALFGWAMAITVSTLTTKQHYLVDVISGLIIAGTAFLVFHRWMNYRPARLFVLSGDQANR